VERVFDEMSRDLRKYGKQTNVRLIIGAMLLLFLVGDGLIYLIYGSRAALMGVLCLLGGLVPVLLVVLILFILDWIRKRIDHD
jgi:hypothetical protein